MKIFSSLFFICLVVAGSLIKEANAELISMDSAFGSDTITLDTDTDLMWLDVTLSTAYSYDGILPELGLGGAFEGYQIANSDEVMTLFTNAGIPFFGGAFVEENYDPVLALMEYVGVTGHNGNLGTGIPFDYTVGHIYSLVPPTEGWVSVFTLAAYEPNQTARASSGTVPGDNQNSTHGTWLVSANSVPEPGTLLLLGVGLIGLGIFSRKKA